LPFKNYHFTIDTENTFPHSSGIASSASGMAASHELDEFRKALNPAMSEIISIRKRLYLPFGFWKCLPKCKGQVVV
jgi:diphosphomevalonate decarboxylase